MSELVDDNVIGTQCGLNLVRVRSNDSISLHLTFSTHLYRRTVSLTTKQCRRNVALSILIIQFKHICLTTRVQTLRIDVFTPTILPGKKNSFFAGGVLSKTV